MTVSTAVVRAMKTVLKYQRGYGMSLTSPATVDLAREDRAEVVERHSRGISEAPVSVPSTLNAAEAM